MASTSDLIIVNELAIHAPLGESAWPKPGSELTPQPFLVTLSVPFSLLQAGVSDALQDSVNYSSLAKTIQGVTKTGQDTLALPISFESFASTVAEACFKKFGRVTEVKIKVEKTRAFLHAKGIAYEALLRRGLSRPVSRRFYVRDLELSAIIGIHPWERVEKQIVRTNLALDINPELETAFGYRGLVSDVSKYILDSSLQTVESLVSGVAHAALSSTYAYAQNASDSASYHIIPSASVSVAKPSALMFASSAEVRVTRSPSDYGIPALYTQPPSDSLSSRSTRFHWVALALGSNLGDRVANIEKALHQLEEQNIRILKTSFMYESDAMYVEDQPKFVNAACLIETSLPPQELLSLLKTVEADVGRTVTFRNGPRVVDLDILLYDDTEIVEEEGDGKRHLQVPHALMLEREFVLRPLADIIPHIIHPITRKTISQHFTELTNSTPSTMHRILPFPSVPSNPPVPPTIWPLSKITYIMATLNTTPDSFSDGGTHDTIPASVSYARAAIAAGAHIIDVGGYSTRPGAQYVSPAEEIARVVPTIRALRQEAGVQAPISIDTFRAEVAREAILAGANCINDVRALREEGMGRVAREFGVPVIMMHSRGDDAGRDKDYSAVGGVMNGVRTALGAQVKSALEGDGAGGLRRWNIVLDPGVGFNQTVEGNLELIRDLKKFYGAAPIEGEIGVGEGLDVLTGMPVLVGASRKSFLGTIIGRPDAPPKERGYATAAACVAAVQQGVDILRVHDVQGMGDAIKVADALYRSK